MKDKDSIKLYEIKSVITKAKTMLSSLLIEIAIEMDEKEHGALSSVWNLLDDSESLIVNTKKDARNEGQN